MSDAYDIGQKRPFPDPNHVSPSRSFKDALMTPVSVSANIPPVIIKLTEPNSSFNSLNCEEQKAFVAAIEEIAHPVRRASAAPGGDLFIFPMDIIQKQQLLSLTAVSSFKFQVTITNAEKFPKGVIRGVPYNESDDSIVKMLSDQGVVHAHRMSPLSPDGLTRKPSGFVVLTFSGHPSCVVWMGIRDFTVFEYVGKPLQCKNCWRFGHSHSDSKPCPNPSRCRKCGGDHDDKTCISPTCCPNCQQSAHVAGSIKCPQVLAKMEVQNFARAHNISSREAAARLKSAHPAPGLILTNAPSLQSGAAMPATSPAVTDLRRLEERLSLLESGLSSLKAEVAPVVATHSEIVSLKTSLADQNSDTKKLLELLPMITKMHQRSEEMA